MTTESETGFHAQERIWVRNVYQGNSISEITTKAVISGTFLAALMVTFNVYMGMKTGWGVGGSIIAAILSFSVIRPFSTNFSVLENNISQTIASAGGSVGNIVNVIPALFLMATPQVGLIERPPTGTEIFFWIFFTSLLGVFFAIPLRKQIVVGENLRFPTGIACAETIRAIHGSKSEAKNKSLMLAATGAVSGIATWFRDGLPAIIPQSTAIPGTIQGCSLKSLTFGVSWSPMMFGAGFLVGPRVGNSMIAGSVIAYGWIVPWLNSSGIFQQIAQMAGQTGAIDQPSFPLIVKWTMWPGIALMVSYGLTASALKFRIIVQAFQSMKKVNYTTDNLQLEVPLKLWLSGLVFAGVGVIFMLSLCFHISVWIGIFVMPLAFIFSTIAVRATGETDINPAGSMGAVTQIIFGAFVPSAASTILAGGVSSACAGESADMMQDLKTGYLLGATPKNQSYGQMLGVLIGAVVAVPIFMVLVDAYGIGSEKLPAPAAVTWAGLAQMMENGLSALPPHALTAMVLGVLSGALIAALEIYKTPLRPYLPSAIGLGVAMVIPAIYSVSIFLGSTTLWLISRKRQDWITDYAGSIGSGCIAGEGLVGVLCAFLAVSGLLP